MRRRHLYELHRAAARKPSFPAVRRILSLVLKTIPAVRSQFAPDSSSGRPRATELANRVNSPLSMECLIDKCAQDYAEALRLGYPPKVAVSRVLWKRYETLDESVIVYRNLARIGGCSARPQLRKLVCQILMHENPGPIDIGVLYEIERAFDSRLEEAGDRPA